MRVRVVDDEVGPVTLGVGGVLEEEVDEVSI